MSTLAVEGIMLYCPKCKTRYEGGTRRFCDNDGRRLLPIGYESSTGVRTNTQNRVFSSVLRRSGGSSESDERLAETPRFVKRQSEPENFSLPESSKTFKPGETRESQFTDEYRRGAQKRVTGKMPLIVDAANLDDDLLEASNIDQANVANERVKPFRIEKPTDNIESIIERNDSVEPVERRIVPLETNAVTSNEIEKSATPTVLELGSTVLENPQMLVGKVIKGRYLLDKILHQSPSNVTYLAEDRAIKGKRVVFRVLTGRGARENFSSGGSTEERVTLSHIDHPNVARLIDSGEIENGFPFIVREFIDGKTIEDLLRESSVVNMMRTGRIIRQASLALREVHQSGILHRNIVPRNLMLKIAEAGVEQVKVTDFAVSDGRTRLDNLAYRSPEQLNQEAPTFASDSWGLAVIAHQMLTGQKPFPSESQKDLIKAQKAGLRLKPSEYNPKLPKIVDDIMAKALAFNPADRYSNARDFGEALFNAVATQSKPKKAETEIVPPIAKTKTKKKNVARNSDDKGLVSDYHIAGNSASNTKDSVKTETEPRKKPSAAEESNKTVQKDSSPALWKNRSPEPASERGWIYSLLSVLGVLLLLSLAIGAIYYFVNRNDETSENAAGSTYTKDSNRSINEGAVDSKENFVSPPPEKEIVPPDNYVYFENKKSTVSSALRSGYRGFTIYYPRNWIKTNTTNNFLDVKTPTKADAPGEQFLVTRYDSTGTYEQDKQNFPKLVVKSNDDLKKELPNFDVVEESPITLSTGWKGYQVKFKALAYFGDKDVEIWGRRIWIPPARPGVRTGFVITMIATSDSKSVKSLDDVGIEGELGEILKTFNPERNYE
ncbi:MAG: serine/threonine protein kinase [Pyrinomonadaceae bacterium]